MHVKDGLCTLVINKYLNSRGIMFLLKPVRLIKSSLICFHFEIIIVDIILT